MKIHMACATIRGVRYGLAPCLVGGYSYEPVCGFALLAGKAKGLAMPGGVSEWLREQGCERWAARDFMYEALHYYCLTCRPWPEFTLPDREFCRLTGPAKWPRKEEAMAQRLKGAWEVNAGVIPGHAEPEYTKQWFYTDGDYEADRAKPPEETTKFAELMLAAHQYGQQLTDPRHLNWVSVHFIWY